MTRTLGFLLVLLTSSSAFAQNTAGRWPFPYMNVDLPVQGSAARHQAWCEEQGGSWQYHICSTGPFTYEFAYQNARYRSTRYVKVRPNYQVSPDEAADWIRTMSEVTERGPANDVMDTGFGVRVLHWNVASLNEQPWVVAMFYNEQEQRMTLMVMTWREWNIEEWN